MTNTADRHARCHDASDRARTVTATAAVKAQRFDIQIRHHALSSVGPSDGFRAFAAKDGSIDALKVLVGSEYPSGLAFRRLALSRTMEAVEEELAQRDGPTVDS